MHVEAPGITGSGARPGNARVVARMSKSLARVFLLIAPAGYGKTTAAQRFSEQYDRVAWCDCSGIVTAKDFAANVLTALARQAGGEQFAKARLQLELASDERELLDFFENAWSADVDR